MKILFNLVKITLEGCGDFQKGSMTLDGTGVTKSALELQKHFEAWMLEGAGTEGVASGVLPEKGVLEFKFQADLRLPTDGEALSNVKMLSARMLCTDMRQDTFSFAQSFKHLLKGSHLSCQQALELVHLIPATNSTRRALCVETCMTKLSDPHLQYLLLQELTDTEYEVVQKRQGSVAFAFTPANPTGHHRLDLSKNSEREIALHLVRFKNTQVATEEALYALSLGRVGGVRVHFDRVWRNGMLNRKPLPYSPTFVLPRDGIFEIDFVQVCVSHTLGAGVCVTYTLCRCVCHTHFVLYAGVRV